MKLPKNKIASETLKKITKDKDPKSYRRSEEP